MRHPQPKQFRLLVRVAALRATGASWATIANEVSRSVGRIRNWPSEYPDFWQRAYQQAKDQIVEESGAEGILILRQLLRSEDEKIRRDAAKLLIELGESLSDKTADHTTLEEIEIHRVVTTIARLTDEERAALHRKIVDRARSEDRVDPVDAGSTEPGAT